MAHYKRTSFFQFECHSKWYKQWLTKWWYDVRNASRALELWTSSDCKPKLTSTCLCDPLNSFKRLAAVRNMLFVWLKKATRVANTTDSSMLHQNVYCIFFALLEVMRFFFKTLNRSQQEHSPRSSLRLHLVQVMRRLAERFVGWRVLKNLQVLYNHCEWGPCFWTTSPPFNVTLCCAGEMQCQIFLVDTGPLSHSGTRPEGSGCDFCCADHGRNFVVKCWGHSFVGNHYSHRVDAEVKFYIYRFPILFLEVFWKQH